MAFRRISMRGLTILAPTVALLSSAFTQAEFNPASYRALLDQIQRLRGKLYLEDGAIEHWHLTVDERYHLPSDDVSCHLLAVNQGCVTGGARLQIHSGDASFSDLAVSHSAQAHSAAWRAALRNAVSRDLQYARSNGLRFIEAGGWALTPELRCTTEALRIALSSFAIGKLLGGAVGLCTATVRHHSSSILRRLGAHALIWDGREIPRYYDPAYGCEMEVMRFDSHSPNKRFQGWIDQLEKELQSAPVFCANIAAAAESESLLALSGALGRDKYAPGSGDPAALNTLLCEEAETQLEPSHET